MYEGNGDLNSPRDDIDQMMDNLAKSDEISFVSLSYVSIKDYFDVTTTDFDVDTITISTTKAFTGHVHYEPINESSKITSFGTNNNKRSERCLQKEEALFIAVAWIVKPAFQLFKLCPEVVWVDVTSHSNNKGFHLLTFSSRLSIGKQVMWMWIFIPNQQRFSFRWVFKEALPKLVPKWLREHVLFFMKDSNPQLLNEILSAMKCVFLNASEGTCRYHVINMGWRTNVPTGVNLLSPKKLRMQSSIVQQVHKWIYSWMTPGNVEDEEEYELSKYLLEKFICSKTVLDVVDEHRVLVYKVIKFLRSHVYTWETLYLHYMRSNVMDFDIAHSSAHKRTNHGLKSHSCAVKPTMNLDSLANTMNIQTSIKVQDCEEILFQDAMQTHKKLSDLPTSQHTTSVGEGILQGMMSRINHYQANLFQDRQRHQHFKYVSIQRQQLKTWLSKSYQVPSVALVISDEEKNDSLCHNVQLSQNTNLFT
jgi:hypothetical protein